MVRNLADRQGFIFGIIIEVNDCELSSSKEGVKDKITKTSDAILLQRLQVV